MTEEVKKGYTEEIEYQKHMLKNLQRWLTLSFLISTIGVLIYYYFSSSIILKIISILLIVVGIIAVLIFGYGIYKGRKNVNKVIDEFANMVHSK